MSTLLFISSDSAPSTGGDFLLCHRPCVCAVQRAKVPGFIFALGQRRAGRSNACIEDITQPFECIIGDPTGLVLPPVFSNAVVAWDSCTHSACLINCCLQSCCSFCVLFLLARIKKSKQRGFIVLFWGNLNWLNMDARYKPTF